MNNRTLLIIFIVALVVFAATQLFERDKGSSFDPVISDADTSKVDRILFNGTSPDGFELFKSDTTWKARQGQKSVTVPKASVDMVLGHLAKLEAQSVVTKDASRYAEFEITDSIATEVTAYANGKVLADLLIGGFRFDQATRSASAFVRKKDKPEVYKVDGFISMALRQNFDQYRDKSILKGNAEDLLKIEWNDASGRKEILSKEDGVWHYAGMEAVDSSRMQTYLQTLFAARGSEFSEHTAVSGLPLIEKIILYGNNMLDPVTISAYSDQDSLRPYLIHSSQNPDAIFLSDSSGLYKQVFTELRQFWPHGQ